MTRYTIHIIDATIEVEIDTEAVAAVAALQIGGVMPGQINVDTTNETATVAFADDHGDPVPAPEGTIATFSSDNEGVVTVVPDPNNPLSVSVTPVAEGTANISVQITGSADPAGNAFEVGSVQVTVSPGAAAEASLTLSV